MDPLVFTSNATPTVGIELELALVDGTTGELSNSIQAILERVPEQFASHVKPELMQSYVEINTSVCNTIEDAERDLVAKLQCVQRIVDELGLGLYWSATHPFSSWQDQKVTPIERYGGLVDLLQDMARQLVCFGLHVHVGVDSGGKAIAICDRMMRHLPTLLALSCNSPWWENRVSGLQSHRSKIMEGLATAGLPPVMRNWSEYVWLVRHLVETGFIHTIREIWWDVRPHHNFGTVEVRICDMPGSLDDALALAGLIQCLVSSLSAEIDQGTYQYDFHPMMVRQNKWRASRFGLNAELIDPHTCEPQSARELVPQLVDQLRPTAEALHCDKYLDHVLSMARGKSWADKQLEVLQGADRKADVVKHFSDLSRAAILGHQG